jgi:hypothetical protein
MALLILIIGFVLFFLSVGTITGALNGFKDTAIKSILLFSLLLTLITESVSFFNMLNHNSVVMIWLVISFCCLIFLYFRRSDLKQLIRNLKDSFQGFSPSMEGSHKIGFYAVMFILALVLLQGIINPPNNWDSMTYHLARITAWISQQSVNHFPTHIVRQVYQPPFSEFVILHVNLLSLNDYFSNAVQFLFLIFCLIVLLSLLELIGLKHQFGWIAMVLLITIPEVILQASSTQNDIVVSFYILSATLFAIKSLKEKGLNNYIFLGLSVGFAILTKGTAYIFLAPVLLFFGVAVLIKTYKLRKYSFLVFSIAAALISIAINSGHYYRNYQMSGHILGVSEAEYSRYANEIKGPDIFVSNFIKNMSNHLGPYPLSRISKEAVIQLHKLAGMDADDPRTNFPGEVYKGASDLPTHEDTAPNPLHFLLILIAFFLIVKALIRNNIRVNRLILYLGIAILIQSVLFSYYLKWQPWHTRLHTPVFMLSIPLICYAFKINEKYIRYLKMAAIIALGYALLVVLFNSSRPYLSTRFTTNISITDHRSKKIYANKLHQYEEYESISAEIKRFGFKNIGLILGREDWEYPLFRNAYTDPLRPIHINVRNITASVTIERPEVDCIISTSVNDSVIYHNSKRFENQTTENKFVWFYYVRR